MAITKKLLEIQKLLKTYWKDWKANYGKYITLDNLLSDLLPVCNEYDILITHYMSTSLVVTSVIDTSDDSKIESCFPVVATDPQKIGWAITYWKRYNLWQIFNIVTDDDDDWNLASWKTKPLSNDVLLMEKEINNIKTLDELATYRKANQGKWKDFNALITQRKLELWKSTAASKEQTNDSK